MHLLVLELVARSFIISHLTWNPHWRVPRLKLDTSLPKEKLRESYESNNPRGSPMTLEVFGPKLYGCSKCVLCGVLLRDTRLCHFCSYNVVENEAHLCRNIPVHSINRDRFPSLFENVVLRSLKSFFQIDHQVNISLCLMEATALHHSRELVWNHFDVLQSHYPFRLPGP